MIAYKCECCGKLFATMPDKNGVPGGVVLQNGRGYKTRLCMDCVRNRADRVNKILERNRTKTQADMG